MVCEVNSPCECVTILCGDFPKVFSVFVVCVDTKAHRLMLLDSGREYKNWTELTWRLMRS